MLIRLGYEIGFKLTAPTPMVVMLYTHPSVAAQLRQPDEVQTDPPIPVSTYLDGFGNRCGRLIAPEGSFKLSGATSIENDGLPDKIFSSARQHPIEELPNSVLPYLLGSRYCEVDRFADMAWQLFAATPPGWARVQAVCDWVHTHVRFDYQLTHPSKSAWNVYTEATGVCRDFQHLAITFCRCLNIPARYATGYLSDIGVEGVLTAMDFSAWFQVYLDGAWHDFDARNNTPRIGRILMATGRDAVDVALTTSFGYSELTHFSVITE